jgi:hypothetical protein
VADRQLEPSQVAGLLVREMVHTRKTPVVLSVAEVQAPVEGYQTLSTAGNQVSVAVQQGHAAYRGNHHRAAAAQKHQK